MRRQAKSSNVQTSALRARSLSLPLHLSLSLSLSEEHQRQPPLTKRVRVCVRVCVRAASAAYLLAGSIGPPNLTTPLTSIHPQRPQGPGISGNSNHINHSQLNPVGAKLQVLHTHTHKIHTYIYIHACIIHAHTHKMQAYIHSKIHTYIHTHIHT